MEPKGFGPNRTLDLPHSRTRCQPIKKATLSKLVPPGRSSKRHARATIQPMTPNGPPPSGSASDRARHWLRPILVVTIALAIAVGCGPSTVTPSPSPSPTPAAPTASPTEAPSGPPASVDLPALYATIEEQVLAIRGLDPKTPVDPTVLDDAGIKALILETFREDNPTDYTEANERLLKALGLLEPDASLEDLYIELLGSQVAGLYSPDDEEALRRVEVRRPGSGREDDLRPRIHPRAPGPELRPVGHGPRPDRPGRSRDRPPVPDRGRCDAA